MLPAPAGSQRLRMLGRLLQDPGPVRRLCSERFRPVSQAFVAAFAQACPHLLAEDVALRLRLAIGTMGYALVHLHPTDG